MLETEITGKDARKARNISRVKHFIFIALYLCFQKEPLFLNWNQSNVNKNGEWRKKNVSGFVLLSSIWNCVHSWKRSVLNSLLDKVQNYLCIPCEWDFLFHLNYNNCLFETITKTTAKMLTQLNSIEPHYFELFSVEN